MWNTLVYSSLLLGSLTTSLVASHEQIPLSGHNAMAGTRPNIVFILTDDQDLHMDSLSYMPHLQKHLVEEGTLYQRHYCTIALCCPSRVSLWTGKAAHNTNVTDVNPPYGGYPKFVSQGFNEAWLPIWFQEAGYNTYYTGKLFNAHTVENYNSPFPAGFNGSDFLLDPYTYQYLNATFQRNKDAPVNHHGEYSTDVLAKKAYGFLDDAIAAENPFFLVVAPNAPHSNVEFQEDWFNNNESSTSIRLTPPIPADRHKDLFSDAIVPRTPNFNPDEASGVSWISKLPKQNQTNIDANDHFYRNRLRALQAVDEIIDGVISRLSDAGILEDTYIFYSSDNGYHIGQHRMQPGKECGFETDINVPLLVRGPGIRKNYISQDVTSHTDLAPTFLSLAGGTIRKDFDGSPIKLPYQNEHQDEKHHETKSRSEHVNVEYWGFALSEGEYDKQFFWNNTYKALRLIGEDYNFYYSVWCSGEHQLYDLNTDPYELTNLYATSNHSSHLFAFTETTIQSDPLKYSIAPTSQSLSPSHTPVLLSALLPRLDALLLVLKTCKARSCTHPWETLHPDGSVLNLHNALDERFDSFYVNEVDRIVFTRCEQGYILESEGPSEVKGFGTGGQRVKIWPRGGAMWSELV